MKAKVLLLPILFVFPLLCLSAQGKSERHEDVNIPVRTKMTLQYQPNEDENGGKFTLVTFEEYPQIVNLSQVGLCFHPFYQNIDNMVEIIFANTTMVERTEAGAENGCVLLIKNGTSKPLDFLIKNYVPSDNPGFETFMTVNVPYYHIREILFPYPINMIRVEAKVRK
jgi:hypothetical protein